MIWDKVNKQKSYIVSLNALEGNQFGKKIYSSQTDVQTILKFFEIDQEVQRDLNPERLGGIVNYIMHNLSDSEGIIYFPPFILSARKQGKYFKEDDAYKLTSDDKLYVLDGQHRLRALEEAMKIIENQEVLERLKSFPITLQIYYDLSIEQEKQLFSDVNSKARRIGANLLKVYAQDDPTADIMRSIVYNHPRISEKEFEMRKNLTRKKLMTGLNLYKIIAMLDSGVHIPNDRIHKPKNPDIEKQTIYFLDLLKKYAPDNAYNRNESIYLNQGILLGIAKVAFELKPEEWEDQLFSLISKYDWSQKNRELESYQVPYTIEKMRYRLNPPEKVTNAMYTILKNLL